LKRLRVHSWLICCKKILIGVFFKSLLLLHCSMVVSQKKERKGKKQKKELKPGMNIQAGYEHSRMGSQYGGGDTYPEAYIDRYKKTSRIPVSAASTNPNLTILKASYAAPFLTLTVSGKDIQGETGKLIVKIR